MRMGNNDKYSIQCGAKKFLHVWISRLPPTHEPRVADAQPISPDGTCITELSKVFLLDPLISFIYDATVKRKEYNRASWHILEIRKL